MVTKPTGAPAPVKGITIAQASRDVFIASINKGQFPFAVLGAIALLLVWRIPENEVVPLIKWMAELLNGFSYAGYGLFAITVFAWYYHAQLIRKEFAEKFTAFQAGHKRSGKS